MKELEALKRLRNGYDDKYYKQFTSSAEKQDEDYNIVLKSLTPPTQEEVCRQLSEHTGREVIYLAEHNMFAIKCSNGNFELIKLHSNNEITFSFVYTYTPSLITLIGRFYQGVKE